MLDEELTLKVCRDIIQNAKCDMDKFVKICAYFSYLESSFEALKRYEREYSNLSDFESEEAKTLLDKIRDNTSRVDRYVAIIAIESAL